MSDAAEGRIDATIGEGVLRLTLAHERARNALTPAMLETLAARLQDPPEAVGAVVLTGAGQAAFSSGADLGALTGDDAIDAMRRRVGAAVTAVAECPLPTVVRVDGVCMGAALELAVAADLRACTAASTFRLPAAQLGIDYPVEGLARYADAVGLANATRIAILGERLDADTALAMGLVHVVAPDTEALDATVAAWTDRLAAADRTAVAGMRASLRRLRGRAGAA